MENYLVPLMAAAIYVKVLVVVAANRLRQKEQRLFVIYLAAAALWSFSDFLLRSNFLVEYKLALFRIVV